MGNQTFELNQQIRPHPDQEIDLNQEEQAERGYQDQHYFNDNDRGYIRGPFLFTYQVNFSGLFRKIRETLLESRLLIARYEEKYRHLAQSLLDLNFNETQDDPKAMNLKEFQILFPMKKRLLKKSNQRNSSKALKRLNQISSARNKLIIRVF